MMGFIGELESCIPVSPAEEIPWSRIDQLLAGSGFARMKVTQQNPVFHGEGDVYTHTRMVCRELVRLPSFQELSGSQKTELFLAALLHDIGKVKTTRLEDGRWVSPQHSLTGSRIARKYLWKDCGICGTQEMMLFRETVCALVRYHMLPVFLMDQKEPMRIVRETAAVGEPGLDFSWHLLCMLAEADVRGRIADDMYTGQMQIELARMMAEEAGCLYGPYPFPDSTVKYAYLSGRNVQPDQTLYDDTWGEVIMVSGLPGTGKDTWIRRNHPDMQMVSLDGIRAELKIKPTDNQGEVIRTAQERAREYLRKKQPFIWNATNLTKDTRQKLIGLFEKYGARVRIVYLETDEETRTAQNMGRTDAVPEDIVAGMLRKMTLPAPDEAQKVEWYADRRPAVGIKQVTHPVAL